MQRKTFLKSYNKYAPFVSGYRRKYKYKEEKNVSYNKEPTGNLKMKTATS